MHKQLKDSTSNKLFHVVSDAIGEGLMPEDFIREVWQCWSNVMQESKDYANKQFIKILDK